MTQRDMEPKERKRMRRKALRAAERAAYVEGVRSGLSPLQSRAMARAIAAEEVDKAFRRRDLLREMGLKP